MANELRRLTDTTFNQLLFADHATDFGAGPTTAANSLISGTNTDIQIDLTSVAASGGARQSAKSAALSVSSERADYYEVWACLEFAVAPTDGGNVAFYWAPSPSATAGTGNPAGVTGTDSAFTPTTGNKGQMQYIGALSLRNNVINIGYVGIVVPNKEYGSLVVVNNGDQALAGAGAMDETHIVFNPITQRPAAA